MQRWGLKACFAASQKSDKSEGRSKGGVMFAAKSHYQTTFFRELAAYGSISGATAGSRGLHQQGGEDELGLLQTGDWAAMTWHLKGYSVVLISLYLRCDQPLRKGANARRLAEIAPFTKTLRTPWIIAGDFNAHPTRFARACYCEMLGGAKIFTLPGEIPTCYKKDVEPSLIGSC